MSRGLNKVMLIGNVGIPPEIRATASGARVGRVSLATNRSWFNKQTGEQKTDTQWHNLTFFGKLCDVVEQYVKKGDRIYVEGRIEYSQTQNDDGTARYWTNIIVDQLIMLGGTEAPPQTAPTPAAAPAADPTPEDDDDLLF